LIWGLKITFLFHQLPIKKETDNFKSAPQRGALFYIVMKAHRNRRGGSFERGIGTIDSTPEIGHRDITP
jgi:hypothetical protein